MNMTSAGRPLFSHSLALGQESLLHQGGESPLGDSKRMQHSEGEAEFSSTRRDRKFQSRINLSYPPYKETDLEARVLDCLFHISERQG